MNKRQLRYRVQKYEGWIVGGSYVLFAIAGICITLGVFFPGPRSTLNIVGVVIFVIGFMAKVGSTFMGDVL